MSLDPKLKLNLIFFCIELNLTTIIKEARLLLKLNLLYLPILIACFGAASYAVWQQLSLSTEQAALDNARVMLRTGQGIRTYTTNQIAPLLNEHQAELEQVARSVHQILDIDVPKAMEKALTVYPSARTVHAFQSAREQIIEASLREQPNPPKRRFHPQSVPAYAASEAFSYFREQFPDYSYKEAVLNPTDLRDRTTDWEADIVNMFRKEPSKVEFTGRRDTPIGPVIYVATPILVDDKSCLTCHGAAANAPPELVTYYGAANGFGWLLNEVVGAQIVSIPAMAAEKRAQAALRSVMIRLAGVFGVLCLLINFVAFKFLKRAGSSEAYN